MQITDVIVFPVKNPESKTKAFAKIVIDDEFIVTGIKVIDGKNGLFIAFPQEYNKQQGKGYDICYPTTAELRGEISQKVIEAYQRAKVG
jgi:stage V sporulation protein G